MTYPLINLSGSTFAYGCLLGLSGGNVALAISGGTSPLPALMLCTSNAENNQAVPIDVAGLLEVKVQEGISPAVGQSAWLSASSAGTVTNVEPTDGQLIGKFASTVSGGLAWIIIGGIGAGGTTTGGGGGDADTLNGHAGSYYLDCSNFTGTLSDDRLSANIPRFNAPGIFSQTILFDGSTNNIAIGGGTDGVTNYPIWTISPTDGALCWGPGGTAPQDCYIHRNGSQSIGVSGHFRVAYQITIAGGSPGNGKFLMSDANGRGSWESLPAQAHSSTTGLQGGTTNQYYHLTSAQHGDLTDGGDCTIHYHASDRNPANLSAAVPANKGGLGIDTSGTTGVPVVTAGTWSIITGFAHNSLSSIQGGAANDYYHLTGAQVTDLTDGGDCTSHIHASNWGGTNGLADLNTIPSSHPTVRYYSYTSTAANKPVAVNNANGILMLTSHPTGGAGLYGKQIAFADDDDLYLRKFSNGTQGTWRKVWHNGNLTGDQSGHYHSADRNPANLSSAVPAAKGGLGIDTSGSTGIPQVTSGVWSIVTGYAHNSLSSIQGGTTGQYYHLTSAQATALTGGASTDAQSYHTHGNKIGPDYFTNAGGAYNFMLTSSAANYCGMRLYAGTKFWGWFHNDGDSNGCQLQYYNATNTITPIALSANGTTSLNTRSGTENILNLKYNGVNLFYFAGADGGAGGYMQIKKSDGTNSIIMDARNGDITTIGVLRPSDVNASGWFHAATYYSSDWTAGVTQDLYAPGFGTFHFKNGLFVGFS